MIVWLLTMVLYMPTGLARTVLLTQLDCDTYAKRLIAAAVREHPTAPVPTYRCEAVPMLFKLEIETQ